ncbi:hypothetical protein DFJ74DRAFT_669481 [Hyaloraphidium curvatum]|nr:hypothetical protein DFJ74DRAFT_669481 [Hyaloraphidium curvatum]
MLSHIDGGEDEPAPTPTKAINRTGAGTGAPMASPRAAADADLEEDIHGDESFHYSMKSDDEDEDMSEEEPAVRPERPDSASAAKGNLKPLTDLPRATPPPKNLNTGAVAALGASGAKMGGPTPQTGPKAAPPKKSSSSGGKAQKPDTSQRAITNFFKVDPAPAPGPSVSTNKQAAKQPVISLDSDDDSPLSEHDDSSSLSQHSDSEDTVLREQASNYAAQSTLARKKGAKPPTPRGKSKAAGTSESDSDLRAGKGNAVTPKRPKLGGGAAGNHSPSRDIDVQITAGNKKRVASSRPSPEQARTVNTLESSDEELPAGKAPAAAKGVQKSMFSYMTSKPSADKDDGMVVYSVPKSPHGSPAKTKQPPSDNVFRVSPAKPKSSMTGDKLRIHEASMAFQIYRTERNLGFPEVPLPHGPGHPRKNPEGPLRDDFDYRVARSTMALPELSEISAHSGTPAEALKPDSMVWRRLTAEEWAIAAEVSEFLYVWGQDAIAVEDEEKLDSKPRGRGRWRKEKVRKPGTMWQPGVLEREMLELSHFMKTVEDPNESLAFFLKLYTRLFYRLQPEVEPPAGEQLLNYPHILSAMLVPLLPSRLASIFASTRPELIPPHLHVRALSHLINHQFPELDAFHDAYEDCMTSVRRIEKDKRERERRRKDIHVEMEEAKKQTAEAGTQVEALEKELEGMSTPEPLEWELGGAAGRLKSMEAKKKTEMDRAMHRSKIKHAVADLNNCKRKEISLENELDKLDDADKVDDEQLDWVTRQINKGRNHSSMRDCGRDRYGRIWWWIDLESGPDAHDSASEAEATGSEDGVKEVKEDPPVMAFGLMIESYHDLDTPAGVPPRAQSKFLFFPDLATLLAAHGKLNDKGIRERHLKQCLEEEFKQKGIALNKSQNNIFGGDLHRQKFDRAYEVFVHTVASNRGQLLEQPKDVDVAELEQAALESLLADLSEALPAFRAESSPSSFDSILCLLAPKVQAADPAQVPQDYKAQIAKSLAHLDDVSVDGSDAKHAQHERDADSVNEESETHAETLTLATSPITTGPQLHVWCLRLLDHQRVYMDKLAKDAAKRERKNPHELRNKNLAADPTGRQRVAARRANAAMAKGSGADSESEDEVVHGRPTRSNTVMSHQLEPVADGKRAAAVRAAKLVTDAAQPKDAEGGPVEDAGENGNKDGSGSESGGSNASFKQKGSSEPSESEEGQGSGDESEEAKSSDESEEEDDGKGTRRSLGTQSRAGTRSKRTSSRQPKAPPKRNLRRKKASSTEEESEESSEEEQPRRKLIRRRPAVSESDDEAPTKIGRGSKSKSADQEDSIEDSDEDVPARKGLVRSLDIFDRLSS